MTARGTFQTTAHHVFPRGFPSMTLDTSPTPVDGEDILIAERLLKAFHAAKEFERTNLPQDIVPREGIWEMMKHEFHTEFDRILIAKDPTGLAHHLSNAFRLPTTHGLGPGKMVFEAAQSPHSADEFAATILDRIVAAAEALGVLPCENPEQGRYGDNVYEDIGDVLDRLEGELGTPLGLPPIMGRFGLRVGHRIVDVRTADSAYVAWRIRTLLDKLDRCRVCEIGGGLARTAQLCSHIGVQQYTLFDLPVINVLQGYFLIKTCGKGRVQLFGEEAANAPLRVLPYWKLFESPDGYFDLCLNQDSLPEIPEYIAQKYIAEMPRIARLFLSINQEGGGPTGTEGMTQLIVPKLVHGNPGFRRIARHPYWVRRGYVEETYRLSTLATAGMEDASHPKGALAQEELTEKVTSVAIDLDKFYRKAAEPVPSGYAGQLEPGFQSALKEYHADLKRSDCSFYHTMDLPGGDHVDGEWDLRGREDLYLGHYDFGGKRVLELGPASGHLTFFMEKSGADVVSFDLPFNGSPALVPLPGLDLERAASFGKEDFRRLRNSWWYAHSRYGSRAKMVYGDIENIPPDVGRFDVSVFAAILIHLPNPFAALKQAAAITDDAIIVVEPRVSLFDQNIPLLYFNPPGPMPARAVYWWASTRTAIQNMLTVLGFPAITITTHIQKQLDRATGRLVDVEWFTIVARRSTRAGVTMDREEAPEDAMPGPHLVGAEHEAVEALPLEEFSQPLPPPHLRHLVSGTEDAEVFTELGKRAFEAIHDLLVANRVNIPDLGSILDFGCGLGRVIRYWRKWPSLRMHGTDINPLLINWCKENLLFAKFSTNTLDPALDFPNQSFGLIYALSVFTHLPVKAQVPWWRELLRVLKPGGYLYITLHGVKCLCYLDQEGQTAFLNGDLVVRGAEAAGTNICAAFHPPSYVRQNFAKPFGLSLINFAPGGAAGNPPQDSYLLRKPTAP